MPVIGQRAEDRGPRDLRRDLVPHRSLAARDGRPRRQARRVDRHRLDRHPGDAGARGAGGAPHRVPAHGELQRAGPQRPGGPRLPRGGQGQLRRHPRQGPRLHQRPSLRRLRHIGARRLRRGAAGPLRGGLGGRRPALSRHLQRPAARQGGERDGVRLHPLQDPRGRHRSGQGRDPDPQGPSLRVQAAADRQPLFRDVQP